MFKALILHEHSALIEELDESRLPPSDVEIAVAYSSLNYKDGLVLNGLGGLVKNLPARSRHRPRRYRRSQPERPIPTR